MTSININTVNKVFTTSCNDVIARKEIKLPRPRGPRAPEFNRLKRMLGEMLMEEQQKHRHAETRASTAANCREASLAEQVDAFEMPIIEAALRRHGNLIEAAAALHIPKKSLYDKLKRFDISTEQFR